MVSPRKSRRKSPCFSSTIVSTPARASKKPSTTPAGPPPAIQQRAVNCSVLFVMELPRRRTQMANCGVAPLRTSGGNHFVLETARGDDQQQGADGAKSQCVQPKVTQRRAAKNDSSSDVDEIGRRDHVADGAKYRWDRFARKNVTGEKHTRQNRKESQLHGLRLRCSFAGNQDSEGECGKKIRQRENRKQQHTAMNRNHEDETHERENQAKLEETYTEIRQQFAKKQTEGAHRRHEKL